MAKRKAISKKLRFEVFKRDSFLVNTAVSLRLMLYFMLTT